MEKQKEIRTGLTRMKGLAKGFQREMVSAGTFGAPVGIMQMKNRYECHRKRK